MAIVSLLSDFGDVDVYVGQMKAVLLAADPSAQLVDLTHHVPPQDVRAGAFLLQQAVPWFPRGTIHLAVVDPGVGTLRRPVVAETADGFFVGPDNGLLTLAARHVVRSVVLPVPAGASATFHGRDVFAPAAGRLAAGAPVASLGRPAGKLQKLDWPRPRRRGLSVSGEVVHVDRFGNLITNLTAPAGRFELTAGDFRTDQLQRTYGQVRRGAPLALVGSHGLVEIAVRDGSAAEVLRLGRGALVAVKLTEAAAVVARRR
jgi:S-adenosyl-L-methionine hydrolase (adenosine-forming)